MTRARSHTISDDGKRLTCHLCGFTSYHPADVSHKYCGHCDIYHDTLEMAAELSVSLGIVKQGPLGWLDLLRWTADTLRKSSASKPLC
jgi:hypothetical protein